MKKSSLKVALSVGLLSLSMVSSADAALLGRLADSNGVFQAYYDDVANRTWLADANYAATSGYAAANATGGLHSGSNNIQADGRMGWSAANAWAAQLTVGGVGGWRLADTAPALFGYQTGSEMGNLFYNVLGGNAGSSITISHNTNYNLFSNVQSGYYWSATEYAPDTNYAWGFSMFSGYQRNGNKTTSFYGWAVQSGDVSAVPVPAAVWLFGSGLLGLIGVARRKSASI